jgi:hypothetical protein
MIGGAKGIGIGIDFGIPNQYCRATSKPYIEKDVLDSLRVVASAYGKSNNDADRSIVKNLVDASNPFIISNTAFKLNSGFGKYSADFESFDWAVNISQKQHNKATISLNGRLCNHTAIEVDEMKVNIIGNVTELIYWYIANPDDTTRSEIRLTSGINTLPKSYAKDDGQTYNIGFAYISGDSEITIEQIPSFEGAFVTDGINDLITSTKTVQEMLGGSNEITVVSMIHQVKDSVNNVSFTNYIRGSANGYFRNIVNNYDKTGIYGYTSSDLIGLSVVNNILGDKNDYTANGDNRDSIINGNFSVQGYSYNDGNNTGDFSSVAWYWTIIANKVLTTDQINQVIAYFNLDRTLKSDIYCNIAKQGITNENHAEFGDKLIDFSGNGRDIQLNNIAWKGDSGIGKYETELSNTSIWTQSKETTSSPFSSSYNGLSGWIIFANTELTNSVDMPSFKIQVKGLLEGQELIYRYYDSNGQSNVYSITKDGDYTLPSDFRTAKPQISNTSGFQVVKNEANIITITQIPSHAGGLCLDGVNDFGKVTGMPIYKDYTVVTDREIFANTGAISSKNNPGAFVETAGNSVYSFGQATSRLNFISTRSISYLSKYSYCGQSITAGAAEDGTDMWLGTIRDNDHRFFNGAIYSLMSFPYSMSEFLIERQLKKHKLGTLYPNMVEFRPVIKSNTSYDNIVFYYKNEKVENGTYLTVGSSIGMHIRLSSSPVNEIKSITVNGIPATFKFHDANNNIYQYDFNLTSKSPQKIDITIDEYIRYEDIVQPYPSLFTLIDYDTEEVYSWGSKLKLGARFKGDVVNLLPNMYEWQGNVLYNGEVLNWGIKPGVVAKEMVFSWNMPFKYLIDNNEPKVILSPRLLRIPNSSYKILGYIPDISGHGNHGVIHNSVYAKGSGVNEDGSYQFDGVNDFVTIPTLFSGGKQVLMKVNWQNDYDAPGYMYDSNTGEYRNFIIKGNKEQIAYENASKTYIDGILNANLTSGDLKDITHNITSQFNNASGIPYIGCRYSLENFLKMSLYDFMLFDEISTDDKIQELNEYVGVEAKVELPPYYWDAYGKTNSDADKDTIQQRGIAIGDYDLTNYNHAYEGMSGYNGYPVVFGANKNWEQMSTGNFTWNIEDNKLHITKALIAGNGLLFSYVKLNGSLLNVKEIPSFKIKVSGLEGKSKLWYRYLKTEDAISETIAVLENGTHELPKSYIPSDSLHNGVWVGFTVTPISEGVKEFDCDITIEVLPEYENGLVYDGITDYSKNANIPALDDFTAIIKREWLKKQGCPLIKGSKVYEGGNGNALLLEWDKAYNFVFYKRTDIMEGELPDNISFITPTNYNGNVITRGSEQDTNGICIAGDGNAGFANMVFYKLILYPKTIPLLQINFLKNLMEKDEIIDLTNPIFIQ